MRGKLCIIMLLSGCCAVSAQDRMIGGTFSFNEFALGFSSQISEKARYAVDANLDMTGIVLGEYDAPGFSVDFTYQFIIGRKKFPDGEVLSGFAGPGFSAGYVRGTDGKYGLLAGLCGIVGMEYSFRVPVSLSLSVNPVLGLTVNRPAPNSLYRMELYRYGLLYSLVPHLGIKYRF